MVLGFWMDHSFNEGAGVVVGPGVGIDFFKGFSFEDVVLNCLLYVPFLTLHSTVCVRTIDIVSRDAVIKQLEMEIAKLNELLPHMLNLYIILYQSLLQRCALNN